MNITQSNIHPFSKLFNLPIRWGACLFLAIGTVGCTDSTEETADLPLPASDPMMVQCDGGEAAACLQFADRSDDALYWNKKACRLGSPVGCANVGNQYYADGKAGEAVSFWEMGCSLRDHVACTNLGVQHQQAGENLSALQYFGKSCLLGDGSACVSWKNVAGQICSSDFDSCYNIAVSYEGESVGDDVYMQTIACSSGHQPSCEWLKEKGIDNAAN
ncbi:hypothetical protein [Gynuella sp.]|uniref:hypothetical protein n=1 Tax=Gynuella sp. TaxID=2969146 RepID=UPI003D140AB5